jgi:hypothetical protein
MVGARVLGLPIPHKWRLLEELNANLLEFLVLRGVSEKRFIPRSKAEHAIAQNNAANRTAPFVPPPDLGADQAPAADGAAGGPARGNGGAGRGGAGGGRHRGGFGRGRGRGRGRF